MGGSIGRRIGANHSGIGWQPLASRRLEGTDDDQETGTDAGEQMKRATVYSAATAAVLLLPGLLVGPSFDAAVFTEVASRVQQGVVPYAGVWDHKPPGEYLLGAVAQLITPWVNPWIPMWTLGFLFVAASAAIVARILNGLGFRAGAIFGGMVAAAVPSVFIISLGGGLTEPMSTLPLAAALLALLADRSSERWRPRFLLAGFLLCLALMLSLIAIAGVAAIGILALLRSERSMLLQRAGLLVFGALLAGLVVFVPLAVTGGLPAAYDALVTYGAAYRAVNLAQLREYAHAQAAVTVLSLLGVAVPALIGLLRAFRLPDPWPALGIAGLIWVAVTALIAVYLGRFETHYAAPLGIPLALLATVGVRDIVQQARRSLAVALTMTAAMAVALALSLGVAAANSWPLLGALQRETERTVAVAAFVRQHAPGRAALSCGGTSRSSTTCPVPRRPAASSTCFP